jgi:asparagine synthase (glutamine-hydrolysing)
MCGIAGLVNWSNEPVDVSVLELMIDIIRHRGPDASGVHLDGSVGLAHARLSIIDLDAGHQPMANEDGTVWITFNIRATEIAPAVGLVPEQVERVHRDMASKRRAATYLDMAPALVGESHVTREPAPVDREADAQ